MYKVGDTVKAIEDSAGWDAGAIYRKGDVGTIVTITTLVRWDNDSLTPANTAHLEKVEDTYAIGDKIELQGRTYIIAQVEPKKVQLINLGTGNRFSDRKCEIVNDVRITRRELHLEEVDVAKLEDTDV